MECCNAMVRVSAVEAVVCVDEETTCIFTDGGNSICVNCSYECTKEMLSKSTNFVEFSVCKDTSHFHSDAWKGAELDPLGKHKKEKVTK